MIQTYAREGGGHGSVKGGIGEKWKQTSHCLYICHEQRGNIVLLLLCNSVSYAEYVNSSCMC